MPKSLTTKDYEKLIADAEKEFTALLAKAESSAAAGEPLAKSEDADKKDEKKDEAKEAKADEKKEDKKDDSKKDDEDKHDYDESDMEELNKMYGSMSKAEIKLHKDTLEKAYVAKCGEMTVAKAEEKPSEPASLAKSEDAEALKKAEEASNLLKSELETTKASLEKTAQEAESAKKEVEDLKKSVNDLTVALNDFLTKKGPVRKAITSVEFVKKSEVEPGSAPEKKELTKSEITAKLNKKASDPSLSKSDREAINKYMMVAGTKLDTVQHLLS